MSTFVRSFMVNLVALSFILAACAQPPRRLLHPRHPRCRRRCPSPVRNPPQPKPPPKTHGDVCPRHRVRDIATPGHRPFSASERMKTAFEEEGFSRQSHRDSIGSGAGG